MADLIQLCFNRLCEQWSEEHPEVIPTEVELSKSLEVSRTTIRGALELFEKKKILKGKGRQRVFIRSPKKDDHFDFSEEKLSKVDWVQEKVMKKIASGAYEDGEMLSELELSREFDVTTGTVREALLKLSPLQLFKKKHRQRWQVLKLDLRHVESTLEFRELLEAHVHDFWLSLDFKHPAWKELDGNVKKQKEALKIGLSDPNDWIELDRKFHSILYRACGNHFIIESLAHMGLIMHLQHKSLEHDEGESKLSAKGHINLYESLLKRDREKVLKDHKKHLKLAKKRLFKIIK